MRNQERNSVYVILADRLQRLRFFRKREMVPISQLSEPTDYQIDRIQKEKLSQHQALQFAFGLEALQINGNLQEFTKTVQDRSLQMKKNEYNDKGLR